MTVDEFNNLSEQADQTNLATKFEQRAATIGGQAVKVNVERSLLQSNDDPAEVSAWTQQNAQLAIDSPVDGNERVAGGSLCGRWTWVRRIAHAGGSVTILDAA